jgi:hypothetical protein
MGFYIPEDDILHSHRRENLKSYNTLRVCDWSLSYRLGKWVASDAHALRYSLSSVTSQGRIIPGRIITDSSQRNLTLSLNSPSTVRQPQSHRSCGVNWFSNRSMIALALPIKCKAYTTITADGDFDISSFVRGLSASHTAQDGDLTVFASHWDFGSCDNFPNLFSFKVAYPGNSIWKRNIFLLL